MDIQRAVAKVVDVQKGNEDVKVDDFGEVTIHRTLAPLQCSHLQQWRGVQLRRISFNTAADDYDLEIDSTDQVAMHLYTDFAALGDLKGLCKAHYEAKRPIPEHFIWYTLKCLVEGMIAMRDGTCESPRGQATAVQGWKPILHLDLKLPNIFLEEKDDASFPKPILGDFGTAESLPLSPNYSRENGTEGWLPPVSISIPLESDYFP